VENSYNSPDSINGLDWTALGRRREMVDYIRGLIHLRRTYPELRLRDSASVLRKVVFPELLEAQMVAWMIDHKLYVVLNAHSRSRDVHLPAGEWSILVDEKGAGIVPRGRPKNQMVVVPGRSLMVLAVEGPSP